MGGRTLIRNLSFIGYFAFRNIALKILAIFSAKTEKVAISRGNLLNIDTFPRLIDIFLYLCHLIKRE